MPAVRLTNREAQAEAIARYKVKKPCHKTHCRCPHRLNLSFQSSRSCALPNIKVLKDKGLEFANSIPPFNETLPSIRTAYIDYALPQVYNAFVIIVPC